MFGKNTKIKAFTFAELMISLVIISVITAILYPTISDLAPNNNKFLFKSTYKTIENIIADIMVTSDLTSTTLEDIPVDANEEQEAAINNRNNVNLSRTAACLCNEFADRMNINTAVNAGCAGTGVACPNGKTYDTFGSGNNTFVTTNGVRWAFQYANNNHEILIDVNASNNALDPAGGTIPNPFPAANPQPAGWNANLSNIWPDAKIGGLTARGIHYSNNSMTQDTFLIRIQATGDTRGKITVASQIGNQHLLDRR